MCRKPRMARDQEDGAPMNAAMAAHRAICPICQNAQAFTGFPGFASDSAESCEHVFPPPISVGPDQKAAGHEK
jgi:hypothetical protein